MGINKTMEEHVVVVVVVTSDARVSEYETEQGCIAIVASEGEVV